MSTVVVTGLGALSCAGVDPDTFWKGMSDPVGPTTTPLAGAPEADFGFTGWQRIPDGAVPGSDPAHPGLGRSTLAVREAARQAWAEARLVGHDPDRLAVFIASGVSDADAAERRRSGEEPTPQAWAPSHPAAAVIAAELDARAGATALSNACAGGVYAIAMGADLIASGGADVVVVGGVETASRLITASFNRLGAVDPLGCRPFDRTRGGTSLGEGAAALVLESEEHARARGAAVIGRVEGHGWSCDAHHTTAPDPSGAQVVTALRAALAEAGRDAADVAVVVPHATGTELSDATEVRALREVFGEHLDRVPVYSSKALLGHTGAASGALSAVAALLMLRHRTVPPNLPVAEPDPECDVLLPERSTPLAGDLALVNAFAFGGHNITLLLAAEESP